MFACNRRVLRPLYEAEASGMADLIELGADNGSVFKFSGLNDACTHKKNHNIYSKQMVLAAAILPSFHRASHFELPSGVQRANWDRGSSSRRTENKINDEGYIVRRPFQEFDESNVRNKLEGKERLGCGHE